MIKTNQQQHHHRQKFQVFGRLGNGLMRDKVDPERAIRYFVYCRSDAGRLERFLDELTAEHIRRSVYGGVVSLDW